MASATPSLLTLCRFKLWPASTNLLEILSASSVPPALVTAELFDRGFISPIAGECNGWTPLMLACFYYAPSALVSQMLTLSSLDPRARNLAAITDNHGRTCLHRAACGNSYPESFKLLIRFYPSALLLPSTTSRTPLDLARVAWTTRYKIKDPGDQRSKILELLESATEAFRAGDLRELERLVGAGEGAMGEWKGLVEVCEAKNIPEVIEERIIEFIEGLQR